MDVRSKLVMTNHLVRTKMISYSYCEPWTRLYNGIPLLVIPWVPGSIIVLIMYAVQYELKRFTKLFTSANNISFDLGYDEIVIVYNYARGESKINVHYICYHGNSMNYVTFSIGLSSFPGHYLLKSSLLHTYISQVLMDS